MWLAKKSSGAPPHRKLRDIPTNTQGWEQRTRKWLHVCSEPAHILKWPILLVLSGKQTFFLLFMFFSQFCLFSTFEKWVVQIRDYLLLCLWLTLSTKHHTSTAVNGAMTILINFQTLILTSHCQNIASINTNKMILLKIFMEKSTLRLILLFVLFSKKTPPFSKILVRFYTMTNLRSSITPSNNKVALKDGLPAPSFSKITKV